MALALLVAVAAAGEPGELARDVVIMRLGLEPLGDRALLVVGRAPAISASAIRRLGNPRRAVEDEGRADLRLVQQQLGLQQLELEADRPQVLAQQEVDVLEGQLVGGALGLRARRHMLGGLRVDLGVRENALGRDWVGHLRDRLAEQIDRPKRRRYSHRRARLLQSIRRVAYITPASAAKSSSEPISSEKASRLSRM